MSRIRKLSDSDCDALIIINHTSVDQTNQEKLLESFVLALEFQQYEHAKILYKLNKANQDSRVLYNQVAFANACNFNNSIWCKQYCSSQFCILSP